MGALSKPDLSMNDIPAAEAGMPNATCKAKEVDLALQWKRGDNVAWRQWALVGTSCAIAIGAWCVSGISTSMDYFVGYSGR
jgi:hypothetical protein